MTLKPRHVAARLNWARLHRRWTQDDWENVIFSDESRFYLEGHDSRLRVYRRRNERFVPACISQAADKRSVMVWGAISATGKSQLVIVPGNLTANVYINNVLGNHLFPFLQQHNGNPVFQHDNAPAHRAHVTRNYLAANNVNVMTPWPALSPDLNPIEHAWDIIGRRIRNLPNRPRTLPQLSQALINARSGLDQADVRRQVLSMRRRCTAVIQAAGHHTRY